MLKTLQNLVIMLLQKLKRNLVKESQKPQLKLVINQPINIINKDKELMNISKEGLELIASFEGFSSTPYKDSVGVWTIGYGTTFYLDGKRVTGKDGKITQEYALELLKNIINLFEEEVKKLVKVELTQNQYDALISLVYNIGTTNFSTSTLLKLLNNKQYKEAGDQFLRWDKAGGKPLKGLTNRRVKERELFLK